MRIWHFKADSGLHTHGLLASVQFMPSKVYATVTCRDDLLFVYALQDMLKIKIHYKKNQ